MGSPAARYNRRMRWGVLFLFTFGLHASDIRVVNAADGSYGAVAPGEIVTIYAPGMGPDTMAPQQVDSSGRVATEIAGTRVLFDGVPAPLASAIRGRIGAVVPYAVAGRESTQMVIEFGGERSIPISLPVAAAVPALFTADGSGSGQAAMLNENGCCNSPRNPQIRGGIGVLYATGEGQTEPAGMDGRICSIWRGGGCPAPELPVSVTVGGAPAEIIWKGDAPDTVAGLLQVNFRIPENAPAGDAVPLVLTVGGVHSRNTVTMAVRSETRRVLVLTTGAEPLARALRRAGYEVETHDEGTRFDLAIADVSRTSAVQLLHEKYGDFRVIAVTPALGPLSLRAADSMGAQALLRRPLSSAEVVRRVTDIVKVRAMPYVAGSGE